MRPYYQKLILDSQLGLLYNETGSASEIHVNIEIKGQFEANWALFTEALPD